MILVRFYSGSRGGVFVVLSTFILTPLFLSMQYYAPNIKVLFIRFRFILLFIILSVFLYFVGTEMRSLISFDQSINYTDIAISFLESSGSSAVFANQNQFGVIFDRVLYRFTNGALDPFLLLFETFVVNGVDVNSAIEYILALIKSTMNLMLPGTPFPEVIGTTSMMMPMVINKDIVDTGIAQNELIRVLNTQPYTIFGFMMPIFGVLTPIYLFMFTAIISFLYSFRSNLLFWRAPIYVFFGSTLSAYGIEVAFQNTLHITISIVTMYFLVKLLSIISLHSKL